MPKVISNTSPLLYLHQLGLLELLQRLYGRVRIPPAVAHELDEGARLGHNVPAVRDLSWIEVSEVREARVLPLATNLGAGEREAIALAVQVEDALLVLDDGLARRHAKLLRIRLTGTLGILLRAKAKGLVQQVAPLIDRLEDLGFRLDEDTRKAVLKLAGE